MQRGNTGWKKCNTDKFWGELAPCEHVLQIYDNDIQFIDVLLSFVGDGIKKGECVVVIATPQHQKALENKLTNLGIHLATLKAIERFIVLNAQVTLSKFMVNGWPDEKLFNETVSEIIQRSKRNGYKVRAFGEMVALLWEQGNYGATVQLESLWNKFCAKESFSLFCAYPKAGFTSDSKKSITHICDAHTKIILGTTPLLDEIIFQNLATV